MLFLDNSSTENSSSNSEGLTDAEIKRFRRHQFTKDEGVCSICMEDYIIEYTGYNMYLLYLTDVTFEMFEVNKNI